MPGAFLAKAERHKNKGDSVRHNTNFQDQELAQDTMEEQEDFIAFSDSAAEEEEEEEGEHPADELIIKKAQDRQQSASTPDEDGASADEAPSSGRKRPRTSQIALNISHTVDDAEPNGRDLEVAALRGAEVASSADDLEEDGERPLERQFVPPVGVTIIGDDEDTVQIGLQKVMRAPRYFNQGSFQASAKKCFNCGKRGHFSRDCPSAGRETLCVLCAKFGHDAYHCPNNKVRCFKCNRLGHVGKDCSYAASNLALPLICTRCGKPDCAASGNPDYYRAEGGCDQEYSQRDLEHVRCLSCGRLGHLSCKPATAPAPKMHCYNCGRPGHLGFQCDMEQPTFAVNKEKLAPGNRRGLQSLKGGPSPSGSDPGKARGRRAPADRAPNSDPPPRSSYWRHEDRATGPAGIGGDAQATFTPPAPAYAYNQVPPPTHAYAGGPPHFQGQQQHFGGFLPYGGQAGLQMQQHQRTGVMLNLGEAELPPPRQELNGRSNSPYHATGDDSWRNRRR